MYSTIRNLLLILFLSVPYWRKFINRLALAALRTATIASNQIKIFQHTCNYQYFLASTAVLKAKYSSTYGSVL